MRIHFSSSRPCALRLGGALAGFCDECEKFAEIADDDPVLAEFLPADGNYLPLSFLLDRQFFENPPDFCDVYRYDCGADIVAARFSKRNPTISVLAQERCGDALATVFEAGTVQLSLENSANFRTDFLPRSKNYEIRRHTLGASELIGIYCASPEGKDDQTLLRLYDKNLQCVFDERANSFSFGETLNARFAFNDIAGHIATQIFREENGAIVPVSRQVLAEHPCDVESMHETLLPFAFFQEVLLQGDLIPFLAPSLAEKADSVLTYLGNFCGVALPKEIFYLTHGKINAAGLIYPVRKNLFEIKFFAVQTQDRKITNILPVE